MFKKFFFPCLLLALLGCGVSYSIRRRVGEGESLEKIAAEYNLSETSLREFNQLGPDDKLRPGDIVFIPIHEGGGEETVFNKKPENKLTDQKSKNNLKTDDPKPKVDVSKQKVDVSDKPKVDVSKPIVEAPKEKQHPEQSGADRKTASAATLLDWPLRGSVLTKFRTQGGSENRGIDIGAPMGTPVSAAAAGKVSYSGIPARAYGPLIIIDHGNSLFTVYSNLSSGIAKEGQIVEKGSVIGESGGAKSSIPAHLHFEVRRDDKPIDPLLLLPSYQESAGE